MNDILNKKILITGGAGFIGSNLVDYLVEAGHKNISVFDNLETGALENIRDHIQLGKINFIQSDIRDFKSCLSATINCDVVFHQAALGSVPRSIQKPLETHATNVDGFINMLEACKQNNVNDLFTLLLLLFMAIIPHFQKPKTKSENLCRLMP